MRKKVLLLITNLGAGGAQRVFSEQSLFLQERYEVAEAVFDKAESEDLYKTGNPQFSLDTTAGNNPFDKIKKLWQRARNLRALIQREQVEVTISHMDGANWVNVLSRSTAKKILVVHGTVLHDYQVAPAMNWLRRRWIIPTLYKKADCVVAVSQGIRHELEQHCSLTNVMAIENGFDLVRIREKANEPLPDPWAPIFAMDDILITSGRMHEQKKQRFLLPLFRQLKAKRPNSKLIILGDGDLRAALLEEAKRSGLRSYHVWGNLPLDASYDVYFPGYVTNPFAFLKRSTLFLFPSGWEGFPLALCEAMIAGVAVLSADCPTGPREILAPDSQPDLLYRLATAEETPYGFLLPTVDKESFTSTWLTSIEQLLANKAHREALTSAAQERMHHFDQQKIKERWIRLIDRL